MTYPAESAQMGHQNHVEDIRSFLDSRHADHYTVFNLSQRNYRGAKFSNRVRESARRHFVSAERNRCAARGPPGRPSSSLSSAQIKSTLTGSGSLECKLTGCENVALAANR